MTTIAWLGTGLLGSGFVAAALGRKDTVRVWNRTRGKAEALAKDGAFVAATPAEAVAGAERVHLCLSDDAAVDGVIDALLAVPGFQGPIVDHTTVTPAGAKRRAQRLADRGIGFLSCPVFMGPSNAREATGRMLCAGPAALVDLLAPALKQMTGELALLGDDVTRPTALKLVGNAMIIGVVGVVADALAVGTSAGLPPAEVLKFATGFNLAGIVSMRAARIERGDYTASFELSMARKDVRLMQETAQAGLSVLPGLAERMDALLEAGHGAKDLAALAIETIPAKGS
jgi:3-hydroxyisobutyrate dehydrogenase-like beta-hydroxyacid dehydrogenase